MKSIILLVVLALTHISLAKPQSWETLKESDYEGSQHSAKQVVVVSGRDNEGSEIEKRIKLFRQAGEDIDEEDIKIERNEHEKVDCDCNKSKPRISYGPEQIVKGKPETYIHHQPKIIVRQPPTHVRIEHPPTIIQPSTIVFRRHGKTIRKPVIYQHLPQDVQVRPVYVKLVKPIEKKVIVEKKSHPSKYIEKSQDNLEFETSYGGQSYHGSFDEHETEHEHGAYRESINENVHGGRSYSESFEEHEHEHEHESYHAHLNIKETKPCARSV